MLLLLFYAAVWDHFAAIIEPKRTAAAAQEKHF